MKNKNILLFLVLIFTLFISSTCKKKDEVDIRSCRSEICFHNNSPFTMWVWKSDVTLAGNSFEILVSSQSTYCLDLGTGTGQGHTFKSAKVLNDCFSSPIACKTHHISVSSCKKFNVNL